VTVFVEREVGFFSLVDLEDNFLTGWMMPVDKGLCWSVQRTAFFLYNVNAFNLNKAYISFKLAIICQQTMKCIRSKRNGRKSATKTLF